MGNGPNATCVLFRSLMVAATTHQYLTFLGTLIFTVCLIGCLYKTETLPRSKGARDVAKVGIGIDTTESFYLSEC